MTHVIITIVTKKEGNHPEEWNEVSSAGTPTTHGSPRTQSRPTLSLSAMTMITMTITLVLVIMVMVIVLYAVMFNPVPVCHDDYYDDSDGNRAEGDGIGWLKVMVALLQQFCQ